MDTLMLKTFREVATRGSMKAASEHLYMAVSSVSSRVKALEDELGTELFVKQGTQYVLTPAGRHFLHYVDHFLRILEQANERVQAMREGHAGELHVATTTTVATYILPRVLKAFFQQYPQVTLRLVDGSHESVVRRLQAGEAEVAVLPRSLEEEGFIVRRWLDDPVCLVLPPGHSLSGKAPIRPCDLRGQPLVGIARRNPEWDGIRAWFAQEQIRPYIIMDAGHVEAVKELVLHLDAACFLPRSAVLDSEGADGLEIAPLDPPIDRGVWWACRKNPRVSRTTRMFCDFLDTVAGELVSVAPDSLGNRHPRSM